MYEWNFDDSKYSKMKANVDKGLKKLTLKKTHTHNIKKSGRVEMKNILTLIKILKQNLIVRFNQQKYNGKLTNWRSF